MEINKTIPEQVIPSIARNEQLVSININVKNRSVEVKTVDENDHERFYSAGFETEWTQISTANKNVIKAFLKGLVKLSLQVNDEDLTGDSI